MQWCSSTVLVSLLAWVQHSSYVEKGGSLDEEIIEYIHILKARVQNWMAWWPTVELL